jgi:hypothetical protein
VWSPEVVAVIAAIEAPLMNVRRAIIFSSPICLVLNKLHHSAEPSEGRVPRLGYALVAARQLPFFPAPVVARLYGK